MRRLLLLVGLLMVNSAYGHIHGRGVATPPVAGNSVTTDAGVPVTIDGGNQVRLDP